MTHYIIKLVIKTEVANKMKLTKLTLLLASASLLVACNNKEEIVKYGIGEAGHYATRSEELAKSDTEPLPEPILDKQDTIKAGTYIIGKDLPAGEYKIKSEGWTTYRGLVTISQNNQFIYQEYVPTFTYLTVSEGQELVLDRVSALPIAQASAYQLYGDTYSQGRYKVGVDLPAGTYTAYPDDSDNTTVIQVLADSGLSLESVLSTKSITEPTEFTITDGQYLQIVWGSFKQK